MPNLPVTYFSYFSTWLIILCFISSPAKTTLSGKGYMFCWWWGHIVYRNCPTPIIMCLYCIHHIVHGITISYFLCLPEASVSGCGENPGTAVPTVCRLLCSNAQGLAVNLIDLTVASSRYDILLCSETLVSDMRHVSELLVAEFGRPVLLWRGQDTSGMREGGIRTRWKWNISPTQVWVWLLQNAGFGGLWFETELICVQSTATPT